MHLIFVQAFFLLIFLKKIQTDNFFENIGKKFENLNIKLSHQLHGVNDNNLTREHQLSTTTNIVIYKKFNN